LYKSVLVVGVVFRRFGNWGWENRATKHSGKTTLKKTGKKETRGKVWREKKLGGAQEEKKIKQKKNWDRGDRPDLSWGGEGKDWCQPKNWGTVATGR